MGALNFSRMDAYILLQRFRNLIEIHLRNDSGHTRRHLMHTKRGYPSHHLGVAYQTILKVVFLHFEHTIYELTKPGSCMISNSISNGRATSRGYFCGGGSSEPKLSQALAGTERETVLERPGVGQGQAHLEEAQTVSDSASWHWHCHSQPLE